MAADRRSDVCGSPNPGAHYGAFPCPGDATLRPLPVEGLVQVIEVWRMPSEPRAADGDHYFLVDDEAMRGGKR